MKRNNFFKIKNMKYFALLFIAVVGVSCADLDQNFEDERYLTRSHFNEISAAGGTVGIEAIDGAILSYFRDGEGGEIEFGMKAIDLGMDLRSNDIDMSRSTWFGAWNRYDNTILTSGDNDFIWTFFYRIIKDANEVINLIPDTVTDENVLAFKHKAYAYRGIAYFYLLRIYQHTRAADSELSIPFNNGAELGSPKVPVGDVKKQILDDLTLAFEGLSNYSRPSVEVLDANVAAAYLARYHLTYENWLEAEEFADIAMKVGSLSTDVMHGFDELSLSETIWGAEVTATTSEVYQTFFSHISQINDGYSGWNHFKTVNSNLYNMIPDSDRRKQWFADQEYSSGVIIVPGTWPHYNITPKYTSLKFIAQPGPGVFIGDYIYLRNAEFYLTKAEALAKQGKEAEAQQVLFDLNTTRDDAYVKSTKTGQSLVDEILLYRRIELWGDGLASFDMARNGIGLDRKDGRENLVQPGADLVIPALDPKMIFEIPQRELDGNPDIN